MTAGISASELMQMIFEYFSNELEFYSINGVVKSVNTTQGTCVVTPDNGDPDIQTVKYLNNKSVADGIILKPKVGSQVTVSFIGNNNGIITKMQEFEELVYDDGSDTATTAKKLELKLNQLVAQVNALKDIVNANNAIFLAHTHTITTPVPTTPGVWPTTPTTTPMTPLAPPVSSFNKDDFNYPKIKLP